MSKFENNDDFFRSVIDYISESENPDVLVASINQHLLNGQIEKRKKQHRHIIALDVALAKAYEVNEKEILKGIEDNNRMSLLDVVAMMSKSIFFNTESYKKLYNKYKKKYRCAGAVNNYLKDIGEGGVE